MTAPTRIDNMRVIRSPRGTELSAKSWLTEAPLRMLMNNLDPDVAERPGELVVYGGIGRAARDWPAFDRIVATLRRLEVVLDHADRQAEKLVERAHPLGVAFGQVVVDRNQVDAAAEQRVGVDGQRGDQRLAFARLHFGDLAFVQDLTAHDLDVEVPHAKRALTGFAANCERLGQHVVERLAGRETFLELDGFRTNRFVGKRGDRRFEGVRRNNRLTQTNDLAFVPVKKSL